MPDPILFALNIYFVLAFKLVLSPIESTPILEKAAFGVNTLKFGRYCVPSVVIVGFLNNGNNAEVNITIRLLKRSVLNPKEKPYERTAYVLRIDCMTIQGGYTILQ